jgi:hypothetical protein
VEAVVLGIAINLASTLLVAGGRRLGEEALGDEQEQALENAFAGATAAMLVEIARHADLDRNLPGRLEEQFSKFFDDSRVAEMLVDSALRSRMPPVDELRRRYETLGLDPIALPVSFERAMNVFAFELATRLRNAARSGGPLAGVVMVADIEQCGICWRSWCGLAVPQVPTWTNSGESLGHGARSVGNGWGYRARKPSSSPMTCWWECRAPRPARRCDGR